MRSRRGRGVRLGSDQPVRVPNEASQRLRQVVGHTADGEVRGSDRIGVGSVGDAESAETGDVELGGCRLRQRVPQLLSPSRASIRGPIATPATVMADEHGEQDGGTGPGEQVPSEQGEVSESRTGHRSPSGAPAARACAPTCRAYATTAAARAATSTIAPIAKPETSTRSSVATVG